MMFQLPPVPINLPKPKHRKPEVITEDGRRVVCLKRGTYLDMSQMSLNVFPNTLLRCEDLETLLLNRNFIRSIPKGISRLDELLKLDLSYNRLHCIPTQIIPLQSLRELDLSNNGITHIPIEIRELKFIKVLNLSNNRIKRLPNNLQHLRCLTHLNVACNKIEEYPLLLCTCFTQLLALKCSYNNITILPYEIIMLPEATLKRDAVDFSHNPLTWPPIGVCVRGFETIRDFIEPKWRSLREFKRRKMIQDTLNLNKNNLTKTNLWDKAPSKAASVSSKCSSPEKTRESTPKKLKKLPTSKTSAGKTKTSRSASKTPRDGTKTPRDGTKTAKKKKQKEEETATGDLDDSSRVTLVEVYGDERSTPDYLSPVPDTRTPGAPDVGGDEGGGRGEGEHFSGTPDSFELENELQDIMDQSFEPPDLDIPDHVTSGFSGGGILEQWLGTVHSMTVSPTTREATSCASSDEESGGAVSAFTPFSDVKITNKSVKDDLSGSESDEEEELQFLEDKADAKLDDTIFSRHSVSTPDLERLSVIFSDEQAHQENTQHSTSRSDEKKKDEVKVKLRKQTSYKSRRSSNASVVSDTTSTKGGKKKRKKRKKKKLKAELSEMELYSRIPFKPLIIAPPTLPCWRGLRTWCYFTEPKSCYLIDNMTDISSMKKVTFGADEIAVLPSTPSTRSLLTGSILANNSSTSDLDGSVSVHSIESNQSQLLSSMSGSSVISYFSDTSPGSIRHPSSVLSTSKHKTRPPSLPAPKHHTWTTEDLQKYIYKPPDLMIPPKVLITYFHHNNDAVHLNQIVKLVNTLELYGLAECICDLTTKEEHNFEEVGYYSWLNSQIRECEYVIVILSTHYLRSLSLLAKLDAYSPPQYRSSPYISSADINRWGLNLEEVQRKFIPIFNDDMEHVHPPSWLHPPPFFYPSEICELGYHLISRDSRESVVIPNIFDGDDQGRDTDFAEQSKDDIFMASTSDMGSKDLVDQLEGNLLPPDVFRVLPVTAHLVVNPLDVPPDWRLREVAGKLRFFWREFAQTCGIEAAVIEEIDSVYSGTLAKSIQCLSTWKSELVGRATYEELSRRLNQIDQQHIAQAYCHFGSHVPL